MQRQRPPSGLGTFRQLLKGLWDVNPRARQKVGGPGDEVARRAWLMRNWGLMLKNMCFTRKPSALLKYEASVLEGHFC